MGVMMGLLGFSFLGSSSNKFRVSPKKYSFIGPQSKISRDVTQELETRIIVNAENSDSEKYLRYAEIITLDRNSSSSGLKLGL